MSKRTENDVLNGDGWNKDKTSYSSEIKSVPEVGVKQGISIFFTLIVIIAIGAFIVKGYKASKNPESDVLAEQTTAETTDSVISVDDLGVENLEEISVPSGVTITIEGDTLLVKNADSGELIDTWIYTISGADVFYKCDAHPGYSFGSDMEIEKLYQNGKFVGNESSDYTPDELNIRNTLDADLQKMQTDLDTISEYKTRLENLGIQVPDLPEMIAGDVIKNNNGIWELQISLNGGVMYEWQNHSLNNGGYIEGASADDIQSMIDAARYDVAVPEFDTHWYYTDGNEFILSQDGFSQTSTDIQNAITGYEGACNAYVADKTKYQCTDLISLLELEISYKKSN